MSVKRVELKRDPRSGTLIGYARLKIIHPETGEDEYYKIGFDILEKISKILGAELKLGDSTKINKERYVKIIKLIGCYLEV